MLVGGQVNPTYNSNIQRFLISSVLSNTFFFFQIQEKIPDRINSRRKTKTSIHTHAHKTNKQRNKQTKRQALVFSLRNWHQAFRFPNPTKLSILRLNQQKVNPNYRHHPNFLFLRVCNAH